jgi:Tol biopolymer transport system component
MALAPGTRLGAYEVTALLGHGGMGAVYRARDTRLGREVALKVLPDLFASDPDRLARFEREAKTLAALNHPHIAQIHHLEQHEQTAALVMELVEGEDLSQRVARGPIPMDEALPLARQIAEALEAAHEQGIVHRDLKPANVKVRDDGTVKVLDFGLAKAMEPAGVTPVGASRSPTITTPGMTQAGMVLGTAAYMSPEQARGKHVDKRTDIWAFGVVLFEMLTGQRAFGGDDISDTMANVLKTEPDWTAVPSGMRPGVQQMLRACLRKDPRQRMGDVQSVRLALEGAFDVAAPHAAAPAAAPRPGLAWMSLSAIALMAAAALSIPAARHLRETPPPETRVDIVTPATEQPASFALSPDGRQIVFVATDDKVSRLWLRSLSTTTAQPLAGTEGATYPFWSPEGGSVGFFAGGALKRLNLRGGAPQTLAPASNGIGGTWNTDGVIVFAASMSSPLMRVSAAGGAATAVTMLGPQQAAHYLPQFLPDGRRLLFMVLGTTDVNGTYLGGLDGRPPTRLTTDSISGAYAPAGFLLWVRAGSLIAQRLDLERAALTGEPMTLADGMNIRVGFQGNAVSIAATGLVAYRTSGLAQLQPTWFDRTGTALGAAAEPHGSFFRPLLSPDGRRVAVARTDQDNQDIWLLDGARASRFTSDPAPDSYYVWSPDGARIVYTSFRTGRGDLFHKLTSGAGVEEPFLSTGQTMAPTSWSANGQFLLYNSLDPETNADIWVMPMSGNAEDRKPFVFLKTPFREAYGAFSPDGRWVAYHSNKSGRPEIYVRPFKSAGPNAGTATTEGGDQWPVSTGGGITPRWRPDGKELYYINPEGAMMAVPMTVTGNSLQPGAPVMLFPTRIYSGGTDTQMGWQYDVTRNGRFLINTLLKEAAAPITLLQNWNPGARR